MKTERKYQVLSKTGMVGGLGVVTECQLPLSECRECAKIWTCEVYGQKMEGVR